MGWVVPDGRLNLVYVCDFASVHSRAFVSYFSERPSRFRVAVVSTSAAPAMKNVQLIGLAPPAVTSRAIAVGVDRTSRAVGRRCGAATTARARLAEDVRDVAETSRGSGTWRFSCSHTLCTGCAPTRKVFWRGNLPGRSDRCRYSSAHGVKTLSHGQKATRGCLTGLDGSWLTWMSCCPTMNATPVLPELDMVSIRMPAWT